MSASEGASESVANAIPINLCILTPGASFRLAKSEGAEVGVRVSVCVRV